MYHFYRTGNVKLPEKSKNKNKHVYNVHIEIIKKIIKCNTFVYEGCSITEKNQGSDLKSFSATHRIYHKHTTNDNVSLLR